jgi:glycosyltransferase involved in cell wall biosynthesis
MGRVAYLTPGDSRKRSPIAIVGGGLVDGRYERGYVLDGSKVAADTAAVMVTHDGERFIRQQCESIFRQSLLPAVLVVVDDASKDGSRSILVEIARSSPIPVEIIPVDGSGISNLKSRVASNVSTGLAAASEYEVAVLSDQDDEWLVDRLASQREILRASSGMLVAGDGILIDEFGDPISMRLRGSFPAPEDWTALDAAGRMRAALRRPFVTGAASALTAELAQLMTPVPRGWLHDRWATLVAVARNRLVLQSEPVIRYRVHDEQLLGHRQAAIGAGNRRWRQVLARGASPVEAAARMTDVVRRLRPIAVDPRVRSELTWRAVLASATERA